MKKIILHWTAGGPVPNAHDKECYHYLIDSIGKTHLGKFKPEANLQCRKGMYAMHTGGGNTNAIGLALCAMARYKNKFNQGNFPITKVQFEAAMKLAAQLCIKYNISITPNTVMTHYEFGLKNPNTSSHGKIDITFLAPYPWVAMEDVGSFIRSKIRWYKAQEKKNME